jgi:tight adherence protein B
MLSVAALCVATCCALLVPLAWRAVRDAAQRLQAANDLVARQKLADLFLFVEPAQLARLSALAMTVVVSATALLQVPLLVAILLSMVVLCGPHIALGLLRTLRARQLTQQLPDAMMLLAAALRSGQGLTQAIAQLAEHQPAPLAQEFGLLTRKQRLGMPFDRALGELRERVPTPDYALFATAVRVARELGGNLAETLERLSGALRRRLAMEDKIRSLTAQGKLQGWIVGVLPLLLLAVLAAMEPEAMRQMFVSRMGWLALAAIVLLELAGFFVIRRIVRIDV